MPDVQLTRKKLYVAKQVIDFVGHPPLGKAIQETFAYDFLSPSKAEALDTRLSFASGPSASERAPLSLEILPHSALESAGALFSHDTLPLEKTPIHLKRERDVRGWVLADLLHLEDGDNFFDLNYQEGRARGFFKPSIFQMPRLLTHTYFLMGLIELLRTRGLYYLHGGCAISPEGRAVLLLGDGGSGKSTSIYLLLREGWSYLGDDALLLGMDSDQKVFVYPLLRQLLLDGTLAHRFPGIIFDRPDGARKGRVSEKSLAQVDERLFALPTLAVVLNRQANSLSRVEPIRKSQLIAELIRQNRFLFMQKELAARHLDVLTRLSKQCEAAELTLGEDVLQKPARLSELIDGHVARPMDERHSQPIPFPRPQA